MADVTMEPSEFEQLIDEAREALDQGDDVRAVAVADQLIAAAPDDRTARVIRAQGLLGMANPQEALDEARRAAELAPDVDEVHRLLATAAWQARRLHLAQQSFERAVELSGYRAEVLADFARFMATERGPRPAEKIARQAIEADANSATAWTALGLTQYKLRRHGEAEESLRRALQIDPDDTDAKATLAMLMQDTGRGQQAEVLVELLEDAPGSKDFVESVRGEAKRRKIAKMLVERDALPEGPPQDLQHRYALWLFAICAAAAGLALLLKPSMPLGVSVCVILPLMFLWYLRRSLR